LNLAILHKEVQQFISDNLKSNVTTLILKGSPFDGISIQELANQIVAKQKSEHKLSSGFVLKIFIIHQKSVLSKPHQKLQQIINQI